MVDIMMAEVCDKRYILVEYFQTPGGKTTKNQFQT